jgi:prefoldin subunit 5
VLYGDTRKQPTAVKFIQDDQRELTTELIPKVKGVAFIRGGRVQILTMKDGNTLVEETAPLADNAQSVIIDQILPVVTTEDFSFDPETTIDAIEHATTVIANRVQICATEVTESIEKNLERIDSFKSSLEALRSSLDTLNSLSTILHDVSLQQYLKGEGPNREVMDSLQKVNTFTQQLNTINSSLADINRVTAKIPTLTTSIDKLCDGIDELESQF